MSGVPVVAALVALAVLLVPGRRGAGVGGGVGGGRTPSAGPSGTASSRSPDGAPRTRGDAGRRGRAGGRGGRAPLRRAGAGAGDAELLALLEVLEPALRAGLPVRAALEGSASAGGLGSDLAAADARGAPLGPVWGSWARATGSPAARVVHRAWRLSERVGSPLADGVADAAEEVRATAERRRRVAGAVAGPRATARLLTALPLAGPVLSLGLGLRPAELWGGAGGPLALAGAVLVVLGHLWCRVLLRDVTRSRRVGTP